MWGGSEKSLDVVANLDRDESGLVEVGLWSGRGARFATPSSEMYRTKSLALTSSPSVGSRGLCLSGLHCVEASSTYGTARSVVRSLRWPCDQYEKAQQESGKLDVDKQCITQNYGCQQNRTTVMLRSLLLMLCSPLYRTHSRAATQYNDGSATSTQVILTTTSCPFTTPFISFLPTLSAISTALLIVSTNVSVSSSPGAIRI